MYDFLRTKCDQVGRLGDHVFALFPRCLVLLSARISQRPWTAMSGGSFGEVYKCWANSGAILAIKQVRSTPAKYRKGLYRVARETLTWSKLTHPNIIPLRGVTKSLFGNHLCLVSEWMDAGNIMYCT